MLLGAVGLFVLWSVLSGRQPDTPPPAQRAAGPGRLLSPDVQVLGELDRLREDNARLKRELDELRKHVEGLKPGPPPARPQPPEPGDLGRLFRDVPKAPPAPPPAPAPTPAPAPPPVQAAPAPAQPSAPPPPPRLTKIAVAKPEPSAAQPRPAAAPAPARTVHVPAGSFAAVTLLSGVYAPVRASQALPVLLHLDEALWAPNGARVPLERCFAVAKALGDYQSRRAILQLDQLSCVLPSGEAWTAPVAGWVSGADGILGVPGRLEEHTGPYLARVALGAFLQGAGAGLAQSQTTVTTTPLGGSQTIVSGNEAQYALLTGLSQIGQRMAQFYERQLESLVPTITVPAGTRATAIVQSGLAVPGLEVAAARPASPWRALD